MLDFRVVNERRRLSTFRSVVRFVQTVMGGVLAVERTTSLLYSDRFVVLSRAVSVIRCPSVIREDGGTVIPRLTKIIRSRITFVSRNVISRRFL